MALPGTHRYGDGVAWSYIAGGVLEDGGGPRVYDPTIVNSVFATFGGMLRQVATSEGIPVEVLATPICMVAENVGVGATAHLTNYLPGFVGDGETPELVYAGCTGLRFDRVRTVIGASATVSAYVADPSTAITAAARHILAASDATRFQVPMVASAYNTDGMRYDGTSRWRMGGDIDRFVAWFNTIVRAAQFDPTLVASAPSFTAILARIVMPTPLVPLTPATDNPWNLRKPESLAAVAAGMMTISPDNPQLAAIWALDKNTLDEIGTVATAFGAGMGLPKGQSVFAYPDRGGTFRLMTGPETQRLWMALRDYINDISYYDVGRASGLPGQPIQL